MHPFRLSWICVVALCAGALGQTVPVPSVSSPDGDEFAVLSGTDAGSGIAYTMISMMGKRIGAPAADGSLPRLTAQCTKSPEGKLRFELLADGGGIPELRFVAPWKASEKYPSRPQMGKPTVKMEFLGYMKFKPQKRQWVGIWLESGEWQYATPGFHSSNMEDEASMMRYLLALPTLRLTLPSLVVDPRPIVVEFETAKWQKRVKAEPMCAASGL